MKTLNRLLIGLSVILTACSGGQPQQHPAETPALKDVYKDAFKIGAAVSSFDISGRNPELVDLILKHFNTLTPGNELKPESLHPRPDVWNWERVCGLCCRARYVRNGTYPLLA